MSLIFIGTLGFGIGVFWGVVEGYYNRKLDKKHQLKVDFKKTPQSLENWVNRYPEDEINRLIEQETANYSDKSDFTESIQSMIQRVQTEIETMKHLEINLHNSKQEMHLIKKRLTGTGDYLNEKGVGISMTNDELDPYLDYIIRKNYTLSLKLEKLLDVYHFIYYEIGDVIDKKCVPEYLGTRKLPERVIND